MSLISDSELTQLTRRRLALLNTVLREECPYVDREALGHWCGLNRTWWAPDAQLQPQHYLRLLQQLHANEVPNIALRLAARTRLDGAGVMGYAMLASPNLEQSLRLACQLCEQTAHFLLVSLQTSAGPGADHALIQCRVLPSGSAYFQLLLEEWLIGMWRYIQVLLPEGVAACASYAELSYGAPSYHWQYEQLLGCRVAFDRPLACLAIPQQWLHIAIRGGNRQARSMYQSQVQRLLQQRGHSGDIVSRVKRLLLERPNDCRYSLDYTAPLLSLSARTLRRYLAAAGSSFRRVCLEVRMELARDYLLNTRLPVQEIAFQLGYSQANNFYRAFRSFFGQSPQHCRMTAALPPATAAAAPEG